MTVESGQTVTWLKKEGHGFVRDIPVKVVKLGKKRVQIAAPGPHRTTDLHWVEPDRLRLDPL